jgi:hypothetical protein
MRSRTRQRYSCAVSSHSVQFMPFITGSVMIDYEQEACYFWSWKLLVNMRMAESKCLLPWRVLMHAR